MDIQVCSFNVCSLRKNIDIVRKLTDMKFDIIFLQETFTVDDKLGELDYIDEHYESVGVGAVFSEKSLLSMSGRPQGGMACLWRTDSCFHVNKIVLDRNISIFCIIVGNCKIVLIIVYLNSDIWETATLTEYLKTLNRLETVLSDFEYDCIYYIGGFNADPFTGRAWHNLQEFMQRNSLRCSDFESLESHTFTFTNYGNSHCKWLDHIIGKSCQDANVINLQVHYDLIGSDYLPISGTLKIKNNVLNNINIQPNGVYAKSSCYIDWNKLKSNELCIVESLALDSMGSFVNSKAIQCSNVGCRKESHISEIGRTTNEVC